MKHSLEQQGVQGNPEESRKDAPDMNRREFLKSVGALVGSVAIAGGYSATKLAGLEKEFENTVIGRGVITKKETEDRRNSSAVMLNSDYAKNPYDYFIAVNINGKNGSFKVDKGTYDSIAEGDTVKVRYTVAKDGDTVEIKSVEK